MTLTDWLALPWTRSAKGHAIRTSWAGRHVSIYWRPNDSTFRFRLDGPLPGAADAKGAIRALWLVALRWL